MINHNFFIKQLKKYNFEIKSKNKLLIDLVILFAHIKSIIYKTIGSK